MKYLETAALLVYNTGSNIIKIKEIILYFAKL